MCKARARAAGIIHLSSGLILSRGEITPLRPLTQEKGSQNLRITSQSYRGAFQCKFTHIQTLLSAPTNLPRSALLSSCSAHVL